MPTVTSHHPAPARSFSTTLRATALIGLLSFPAGALGTVRFEEDFESYAPGSNLIGQNGWAGSGPGGFSSMIINPAPYLGTQALDGRDAAGSGWIMYAGHAVDPLSADEVTTLQIDAYATTAPATINSGIGIGNEPAPDGNNFFNSFAMAWSVNAATGSWYFDTRALGGGIEGVAAGIDEAVTLQIVIDGPAGEVYGVLDGAVSGRHETARTAISPAVIAGLDAVALHIDKSTVRTGAEFDNLILSSEPPLPPGVRFSEDFESYAPGSDLVGQNGWSGSGPGGFSTMIINPGTSMDSQVLDGRDAAGSGWIMYVGHAIGALSPAEVCTLQVDAYATSSPATINSGIGIGREPSPNGVNYGNSFVLAWTANATNGSWNFDTRAIGGTIDVITAGIDEQVTLQIVVDGPAGMAYGVLQGAAAGRHETPRYPIDAATIAELDAVAIHIDKSTIRTGAEFDNLTVSSVTPITFSEWASDQGLPAGQAGPQDDPNHDRVPNLVACFVGSDGTEFAHPRLPRIERAPGGGLCLVFQRAKEIKDIAWLVEVSTDGDTWVPAPPPVSIRDMGEIEIITTDVLEAAAAAAKAVSRLSVTLEEQLP